MSNQVASPSTAEQFKAKVAADVTNAIKFAAAFFSKEELTSLTNNAIEKL